MIFKVCYKAKTGNGFIDWFYDRNEAKDLPSAFSKALGIAKTLEVLDAENGIQRKFSVDSISKKE